MQKIIKCLILVFFCFQVKAVELSDDNKGQVLLFPYFTVNDDFRTLINITNTTNEVKALRVTFREAANGRAVYLFNLYLGANDTWVASLKKGNQQQSFLTFLNSEDNSCTFPNLSDTSSEFYKFEYTGDNSDNYSEDTNRMHEGSLEIIEMGVVTGNIAQDINNGNSCHSGSGLEFLTRISANISKPTGGITGNIILINVPQGLSMNELPTALDNFSDEALHIDTFIEFPNLDSGNKTSIIKNANGKKISHQWENGYEAVTAVLMKSSINNEYALDTAINAQTDWIITMPTRAFYTDSRYVSESTARAPFTANVGDLASCEPYSYNLINRESMFDDTPVGPVVIGSPPPPGGFNPPTSLCFATNNINFSNDVEMQAHDIGIFASQFSTVKQRGAFLEPFKIISPFDNGWSQIVFDQNIVNDETEDLITGLPVIGFSVQKYANANAQAGVLANYGALFAHKNTVNVTTQDTQNEMPPMSLAGNNIGQVLIYPYYTVRNSMVSLMSIVNHTDSVKALKINFREGKNARIALTFNIYLGAFDTWVSALTPTIAANSVNHDGEKSVKIRIPDHTCTVPNDLNEQEFLPFWFNDSFNDRLGTGLNRVREGFIEIIDMGTLTLADAAAATPDSTGIPADCLKLQDNWEIFDGQWEQDSAINLIAPDGSGSISGSLSIINVATGLDMNYDATALINFSDEITHTTPGSDAINLSSGTNQHTYLSTNNGLVDVMWDSPLDAVSSLLMATKISNNYVIDSTINAQTEWINTYPTKQYYIDPIYEFSGIHSPFTSQIVDEIGSCEPLDFTSYNREALSGVHNFPVPLLPPGIYDPFHCWSVNVADIDDTSDDDNSILTSDLLVHSWLEDGISNRSITNLEETQGWMQWSYGSNDFQKLTGLSQDGTTYEIKGVPVIGLVIQSFANGTLTDELGNQTLANYAIINKNNNEKEITILTSKKSHKKPNR